MYHLRPDITLAAAIEANVQAAVEISLGADATKLNRSRDFFGACPYGPAETSMRPAPPPEGVSKAPGELASDLLASAVRSRGQLQNDCQ
jgi:hypothetical protein